MDLNGEGTRSNAEQGRQLVLVTSGVLCGRRRGGQERQLGKPGKGVTQ